MKILMNDLSSNVVPQVQIKLHLKSFLVLELCTEKPEARGVILTPYRFLRAEKMFTLYISNLNLKNYSPSEKVGISVMSQWAIYPILNVLSVN